MLKESLSIGEPLTPTEEAAIEARRGRGLTECAEGSDAMRVIEDDVPRLLAALRAERAVYETNIAAAHRKAEIVTADLHVERARAERAEAITAAWDTYCNAALKLASLSWAGDEAGSLKEARDDWAKAREALRTLGVEP